MFKATNLRQSRKVYASAAADAGDIQKVCTAVAATAAVAATEAVAPPAPPPPEDWPEMRLAEVHHLTRVQTHLQCSAVQCSAVQCTELHCTALWGNIVLSGLSLR